MRIGYEAKRIFHNRSGLGNYGRNLISALHRSYPNDEYWLYNPKTPKIPFGQKMAHVEEKRPSFTNPLFVNIWRQRLLSDRAARDKIDLFHGLAQELPQGLKRKNIPAVVSVHDLIFMRMPQLYKFIDRRIYIKKLKLACAQASSIVAISEQTRRDLHQFLHIPMDRITVIYQGCDPLHWQSRSEKEIAAVKEKYRLPQNYLLFVGTLEERKNVDKVLNASQRLNIPAVFIGKKTRFWKDTLTSGKYLDHSLLHTPVIDNNEELSAIYQGARLFTYPSSFEGFGIPVLEALVSKVPVITSTSSSLPEVAGPSSVLVNPDDQEELAEAINRVWHSEDLRQKMTESGYTFAGHFKDEVIAEKWHELYKSLL